MQSEEAFNREIKLVAKNKKANFLYKISQTFEAGLALKGTEVKSLRAGKVSIQEAYCAFENKRSLQLFLIDSHITPWESEAHFNHEPKRKRKLLLKSNELIKLKNAVMEKGMTIVPLQLYFSGPFAKLEIGLAQAKRKFDKRETKKKQETDREIRRKFRY